MQATALPSLAIITLCTRLLSYQTHCKYMLAIFLNKFWKVKIFYIRSNETPWAKPFDGICTLHLILVAYLYVYTSIIISLSGHFRETAEKISFEQFLSYFAWFNLGHPSIYHSPQIHTNNLWVSNHTQSKQLNGFCWYDMKLVWSDMVWAMMTLW